MAWTQVSGSTCPVLSQKLICKESNVTVKLHLKLNQCNSIKHKKKRKQEQ